MSYTVNWNTKVFTIPLGDLTLISGSNYSLDASDFWIEVRRLEASPLDGLYAIQALEFVETQILSGIPYAPIVKLINGYTWDINSTNINVSLIGTNSNLLDHYIPGNGISVLANNSAGKQQVGSGLSVDELLKLTEIWQALRQDPDNALETDEDGTIRVAGRTITPVTTGVTPNRTTTQTRSG